MPCRAAIRVWTANVDRWVGPAGGSRGPGAGSPVVGPRIALLLLVAGCGGGTHLLGDGDEEGWVESAEDALAEDASPPDGGGEDAPAPEDAGADGDGEAVDGPDAGADDAADPGDAAPDEETDGVDAPEADPDGGSEAGDSGSDGPGDFGDEGDPDEGVLPDADGSDGCVAPPVPRPLAPLDGTMTGSLHAPAWSNTLRPLFRWEAGGVDPCGPGDYEISVDDTCDPFAFDRCTFPSPEAGAPHLPDTEWRPPSALPPAPPGGTYWGDRSRRYFWRVRACRGDACSDWSPVRYFILGISIDQPHAHGIPPLLHLDPTFEDPGSFPWPDGSGCFLFSPGLPVLFSGCMWASLHPGDSPWDLAVFGTGTVWLGDLDADGYPDLGVQGETLSSVGGEAVQLLIIRGRRVPDMHRAVWTLTDGDAAGPRTETGFARASAPVGDLNQDGYADLAVSAPAWGAIPAREGELYLYLGGPAGPSPLPDHRLRSGAGEAGDRFGWTLTAARDADRDGVAEIAVSAPGLPRPGGHVGAVLVFGLDDPLPDLPEATLEAPAASDPPPGTSALAWGDFQGDGFADLAASAAVEPGAPAPGRVALFYRTPAGFEPTPGRLLLDPDHPTPTGFGTSLAVGDFDADGYQDLAVAAPGAGRTDPGVGAVFVYYGGPLGLPETADLRLEHPDAIENGAFGYSLAQGSDKTVDGYDDLLVGAPGTPTSGGMFLFPGGPSGLDPVTALRFEGDTYPYGTPGTRNGTVVN